MAAQPPLCHRMLLLKRASLFLRWSLKIVNNNVLMSRKTQRSQKSPMKDMVMQTGRFFLPLRRVVSMQLLRWEFALV